ncbi:MAG: hypothetical protein JXA18_02120 [Chitinispirillaceae bacterium]|nr:hypothetical protein [Chitinispirillaceae bacterium]
MKRERFSGSVVRLIVICMLGAAIGVSGQGSTLSLNVGGATHKISKALYGVLMENYGRCIYNGVFVGTTSPIPNTDGMRNDVIEGFKEAGVGCIEWPGGCFADEYHWKDGIDMPQSSRPGGEMRNGLGTPEFFKLCSLTNAYAYPTANIQSGSSAEMNAWLNYIHDRPSWWSNMPFWKIGNEEWDPCGNMTQSQYQSKFDQWYDAEPEWAKSGVMHIMDGGPGGGWVNTDASYARGNSGPMGISYHRYTVIDWSNKGPSSDFSESQYYAQVRNSWGMDNSINGYNLGNVALCVDEWGAWYDDVPGLGTSFNWSTARDAVIAGMNLNIFNNRCDRVKMALVAQPVNVIQSLMVTENSGEKRMRKTPVFWVFKMYKPHQEAKMVPATMNTGTNQSIPVLNASASIDAGNSLHVSIVNTHASASQNLTINLTGMPSGVTYPSGSWSGQIVNGKSITSGITSFTAIDTAGLEKFTDFSVAGTSVATTLPAHSVVMLTAAGGGTGVGTPAVTAGATDAYSIRGASGGEIVINCTAAPKTPLRCTLYGIDGRRIGETFNATPEPGRTTLTWLPKGGSRSANMYIVKMETGAFAQSQPIILTR